MAAANPMLFAEGVPNAAAAKLSLTLVSPAHARPFSERMACADALRLAAWRIASGETQRLIVCAGEEASPVVDAAYENLCGGPKTMSVAVAFVLERASLAAHRKARKHAILDPAALHSREQGDCVKAIVSSDASPFSAAPLLELASRLLLHDTTFASMPAQR